MDHNIAHSITPTTIKSTIKDMTASVYADNYPEQFPKAAEPEVAFANLGELHNRIKDLEKEMYRAAGKMEFEEAALLRDLVKDLKEKELQCL